LRRNDTLIDQPTVKNASESKFDKNTLNRWKKAVIHLEVLADSKSFEEKTQEMENKSFEEQGKILRSNSDDIRRRGTAILFENEGKKYLLTARHVVFDELNAKKSFNQEVTRLKNNTPQQLFNTDVKRAEQRALNTICKKIVRVISFDEIASGHDTIGNFLFLLRDLEYTYSTPEIDLAIISLYSVTGSELSEELFKLGYKPITLADIADSPSEEGADVFTVGYPDATAVLGQLNNQSINHWGSDAVSIPTFAFGKVSMLNDKIFFFLSDISVYPGNSGGPVIENGKLVGVVSQQSRIHLEDLEHDNKPLPYGIRIPFGRIIKAKYIKELVESQKKKDADFRNMMNPH
jgi:hypothetical protein